MNADLVDQRLDLLNVLRAVGYEEFDVKLTDTGHDFVVSFDGMQRLIAVVPPSARPGEWHGAELAVAIENAPGPDDFPLCVTARESYTKRHVEEQLGELENGAMLENARKLLEDRGVKDPNPNLIRGQVLRWLIGGSLSLGMSIGLALAGVPKGDDA